MSMYGQTQVAGAQKKDIAMEGAKYEAERAKQQGLQDQNAGTVADTLKTYSPDANAQRLADATQNRTSLYTAPIAGKNYTAATPADYDPNNVVGSRNAATGAAQKAKDLTMAGAKAKLDATGDASTLGGILAANNANKIGTTNRIAAMSEKAQEIQQGVLPAKMNADKGAGATASGIGDFLKMAAMMNAGSGNGIGNMFKPAAGVPASNAAGSDWMMQGLTPTDAYGNAVLY